MRIFLLLIFSLSFSTINAQNSSIKVRVVDEERNPLFEANVLLSKGDGTMVDETGSYSFQNLASNN